MADDTGIVVHGFGNAGTLITRGFDTVDVVPPDDPVGDFCQVVVCVSPPSVTSLTFSILGLNLGYQVLPGLKRSDPE